MIIVPMSLIKYIAVVVGLIGIIGSIGALASGSMEISGFVIGMLFSAGLFLLGIFSIYKKHKTVLDEFYYKNIKKRK